jgi:hypothetical protein
MVGGELTTRRGFLLFGKHTDIMASYEPGGIGHPMNATKAILIASLFLFPASALPQSVDKEPAAIVELGRAASWNVKDGGSGFGPHCSC